MKTIGLLGGMSWESTMTYYRLINEGIKNTLGGLHSARCVLYSVDFHEIEQCQASGDWKKSAAILGAAALRLEKAGADFLLICTNTMHKVAPQIAQQIRMPIVHIADATAERLKAQKIGRVGLLGTAYTMEQDFYTGRLREQGIEVLVPSAQEREMVSRVIYEELCVGRVEKVSRIDYLRVIDGLAARGAQGVILGCTEIGLLVTQRDTRVPLFDTTVIHAEKAVHMALN